MPAEVDAMHGRAEVYATPEVRLLLCSAHVLDLTKLRLLPCRAEVFVMPGLRLVAL
jgi:hypothetical protein